MQNKIKVLFVSDDIRFPTGLGIQTYKLLTGLFKLNKYEIIVIGGSIIDQSPEPIIIDGIKIYPVSNGYGNPQALKMVLSMEKPDILVVTTDPRFAQYIFTMDNEIRNMTKLVLWHAWDNDPFPEYNKTWYNCCDHIATFSNFSSKLLTLHKVENTCIPLGLDPTEFYPLPGEIIEKERQSIIEAAGLKNIKRLIFWNNRNIHRKRVESVLSAFCTWFTHYNKEKDTAILLNTNSYDPEGNDVLHLIYDLYRNKMPIIFNLQRITSPKLNTFYNVADLTINVAYNEGFGLCVGESLLAGTPVLVTRTGGMTEQVDGGVEQYGVLLKPDVRDLFGTPGTPYIYRDFVSEESIVAGINKITKNIDKYRAKALRGRDHIINNFNILDTVRLWDKTLEDVYKAPSKFSRYSVELINKSISSVIKMIHEK